MNIDKTGVIERRVIAGGEVRVERREDGSPSITGKIKYDKLSEELGGFREKIAPGAFAKSLDGDVRSLFNHDSNVVLGRTKSKTLELDDGPKALTFRTSPPDTQAARDVVALIERGDVDGNSFAFVTEKDEWERGKDGKPDIRTLLEVRLMEVGPVTFPAYPDSTVALRSHEAWKRAQEPEEPEGTPVMDGIEGPLALKERAAGTAIKRA